MIWQIAIEINMSHAEKHNHEQINTSLLARQNYLKTEITCQDRKQLNKQNELNTKFLCVLKTLKRLK